MATLGLSMIAKNEEHTLGACLTSVRDVVSQIVIGDTGSTDGTVRIAREFGATVISVPWENHFAKARNAALVPMTTDWVLVLDADEELDAAAKAILPQLLAETDIGGYMATIRNYMPVRTSYFLEHPGIPVSSPPDRARTASCCHDQPTLLVAKDLSAAAEAAERLAECLPHPKAFLRAASIRAALAQWERSEKLLEDALELFPDFPGLRDARVEAERHRRGAREQPQGNPNQPAG